MAFLTRLAFLTKWNQRFRNNDLFEIVEADLRDFALDAVDTFGRQGNAARAGVKFVHSLYRADEPVAAVREELDPLSMCLGTICYSEFAPTPAEKVTVLVWDPSPTALQVWLDGRFEGQKIGGKWVSYNSAEAAGSRIREFNALDPAGYQEGELVQANVNGVAQFYQARHDFIPADYPAPAGFPAPTDTADNPDWKPVSPPNPVSQPTLTITYATLLAALEDEALLPGVLYRITARTKGQADVLANFDSPDTPYAEYARVEGDAGIFRYDAFMDTASKVGGDAGLQLFYTTPDEYPNRRLVARLSNGDEISVPTRELLTLQTVTFQDFTFTGVGANVNPYTFIKGLVYNDIQTGRAYECRQTHTVTRAQYPMDGPLFSEVIYLTNEAGEQIWNELSALDIRMGSLPGKMPKYYATHTNGTIFNGEYLNAVAGSISNDSGRVYVMGTGSLTGDATLRYNNQLYGNDYTVELNSYNLLQGRGSTIDKLHVRNGKLNLYGTTVCFFNEGSLISTAITGPGGQMINLHGTKIDCPAGFQLVRDGVFVNWYGTATYPNPALPAGADVSGGTVIIHPYVAPADGGSGGNPAPATGGGWTQGATAAELSATTAYRVVVGAAAVVNAIGANETTMQLRRHDGNAAFLAESTGNSGYTAYVAKGSAEADLILQHTNAPAGSQAFYFRVKNGAFDVINLSDNLGAINNYVVSWRANGRMAVGFGAGNESETNFQAVLNVGGNAQVPSVRTSADIEITDAAYGMIQKSPNGQRWRLQPSNTGQPIYTPV
jgi:hypothetical protein